MGAGEVFANESEELPSDISPDTFVERWVEPNDFSVSVSPFFPVRFKLELCFVATRFQSSFVLSLSSVEFLLIA